MTLLTVELSFAAVIALSIQISPRTLAEFMMASPSTQRRIVHTNKHPSDDESKAIVAYYRDARAAAERFFRGEGRDCVIERAISTLSDEIKTASPVKKIRLIQNVRAIKDFQKSVLANRRFAVAPRACVGLELGGIALNVRPSLCLSDQEGQTHWLCLDFSSGQMEPRKADIVLQLFLQAAQAEGIDLKPRHAEYHHFHSGQHRVARRHGGRLESQIAASCQTFGDIWTSI